MFSLSTTSADPRTSPSRLSSTSRSWSASSNGSELAQAHLPDVPDEIPTVHFQDALQLVGANPDEPDLAPEHERHLGQWAREKFGSDFLAVEGYPAEKRPCYSHPQPIRRTRLFPRDLHRLTP
jgi:aspartyl/asparaginyl-tRNA synthetase